MRTQSVTSLGIVGLFAFMVPLPALSAPAATGPAEATAEDADQVVIVADGVARAAIVVAQAAPEAVIRAAEELRWCIEQMTSVALPLVDDVSAPETAADLPELLICVGPSDLTAEVANALPGDAYAPGGQDAVAMFVDGKIILTGGPVLDGQTTEYAVAAFLRHLGAECYRARSRPIKVLPAGPRLAVPKSLDIRVQPAFVSRAPSGALLPPWSSAGGVDFTNAHNWFRVITRDFFGEHPQWFALIDGERDDPGTGSVYAICETHPEVVNRFVDAAAEAFESGREGFSLTPNDCVRGLCQCEICLAVHGDGAIPADRMLAFANRVRAQLDREYPRFRARKLHILAGYGHPEWRIPPSEGVVARRGVVVWVAHQGCHAHTWDDPTCPANREWAERLDGWSRAAQEPLGVYEYACYSNYNYDRRWSRFPVVSLRRVIHDIAAYRRAGVGYLQYETEGYWDPYMPFRWVHGYGIDRALLDPDIDPDELLRTLCEDLYGPASVTMYEYYDLLQTRLDETDLHAGNWYLPDPAKVYTEDDIRRLTELIHKALWQCQKGGGAPAGCCLEAQKVWSEAVASLNDPDRAAAGPKTFHGLPWPGWDR